MLRRIGIIFSLFFLVSGGTNLLLNIILNNSDYIIYSGVLLVFSLLYFLTTLNNNIVTKACQILLTISIGCMTTILNPSVGSLPVMIFYIGFALTDKYFKDNYILKYCNLIPYILATILAGWAIQAILLYLVLYLAFAGIIYVINNDK